MTSWREGSNLDKSTAPFVIDCGAFTGNFNAERWEAHLKKWQQYNKRCLFVIAPDVLFDSVATQSQYEHYRAIVRSYGYRVAFVAQDGQTVEALPSDYDCLFIGGSTPFKYSPECQALVREAKSKGKWVHMGRVNSQSRIGYCKWLGCDSVDGTHISFAPKKNTHKVVGWMAQSILWEEQ